MGRLRVSSFTPMLAVLAAGMFLIHAVAAVSVLSTIARGEGVGDWTSFYAAGTMVRTGDGGRLYDFGAQSAAQLGLFGEGLKPNAYPLPAFVAVLLAPLTGLSFTSSFWCVLATNCALVLALAWAAWRYLDGVPRGTRVAFVACASCCTPVVITLLLGQFDLVVLAAILACFALRSRGRPYSAGVVLAIALIKPHIAAATVLMLLVQRDWRTLAAFAAAGVPLLLAPALVFGPHILVDQARLIGSYPGSSTDHSVAAAMMVNVRGAAVSITGSSSVWLWAPPLAVIAAASLFGALHTWRSRPALDPQCWAVALALPLTYSPHLHAQTMVLLLGAAALYVRASSDAGRPVRTEWVLGVYSAIGAFWLLSIAGIAVTFVPILLAYRTLVRAWPPAASVQALAESRDEARAARAA